MTDVKKRIMVDMSATLIHHGHIRLLKEASKLGKVIVGLTIDEEIKANRLFIDFVIRFIGQVHSTGFRPPNPSILISGYDLERVTNVSNQRQNSNPPPGGGRL